MSQFLLKVLFLFSFCFYIFASFNCKANKEHIQNLKPKELWNFFYEISCHPRCSGNERIVRKYIEEHYAKKNNFEFKVDKVGNLLVKVPPTKGFEKKPTVIIQNHMDMVCVKKEKHEHDFDKDPIQLIKDKTGLWIKANFTSLGADNGLGMSHALALGIDININHGPLELLFTVEEETTFKGVNNLSPKWLTGKYLINVDSSWIDGITVGSSGGVDVENTFEPKFEYAPSGHTIYLIKLFGMIGGHSTVDIDKHRANSIKLMVRVLNHLSNKSNQWFRLITLKSNSESGIPNSGIIYISLNPKNEELLINLVDEIMNLIKIEYLTSDPKLSFTIDKEHEEHIRVLKKSDEIKIMKILQVYPDGVQSMESDYEKAVQTSVCISDVNLEDGEFSIEASISSSMRSSINNTILTIKSLAKMTRMTTEVSNYYPEWIPDLNSKLLNISKDIHKKMFNKDVKVSLIHGGLETGVINSKYPKLEMIAIGSVDENAHSIEERVLISSVKQSYDLLCNIIKAL
eukprot:gene2705-3901_t